MVKSVLPNWPRRKFVLEEQTISHCLLSPPWQVVAPPGLPAELSPSASQGRQGNSTAVSFGREDSDKPAVKGEGWTKAELSSSFSIIFLRLLKWFSICTAGWNMYSLSAILNPVENRHRSLQTSESLFFHNENITSLASPSLSSSHTPHSLQFFSWEYCDLLFV